MRNEQEKTIQRLPANPVPPLPTKGRLKAKARARAKGRGAEAVRISSIGREQKAWAKERKAETAPPGTQNDSLWLLFQPELIKPR